MFLTRWPNFPCGQVATPLVYSEDLSVAQQIAHIFGLIQEIQKSLSGYLTIAQYNSFLQWLDDELAQQLAAADYYTDSSISDLESRINEKLGDIAKNTLQYDVTRGIYTNTMDAMRNLFNDVTWRAWSHGEFMTTDFTVENVAESGLNCRGFAVANRWLVDDHPLTQYYLAVELPEKDDAWTYQQVKDSGLIPVPEILDSDYRVSDLANSAVRATGNVYVPNKES